MITPLPWIQLLERTPGPKLAKEMQVAEPFKLIEDAHAICQRTDWTSTPSTCHRKQISVASNRRQRHEARKLRKLLLHFDGSARLGKLLLDRLGFFLRDAFLYRLGSSVDQVLGFFQAQ